MADKNIERRIIIGLIASTEFIKQIRDIYNPRLIESSMAKRLAAWCIEYYDKYAVAPGKEIEHIFYERLQRGLPKEVAEEIEQDILPGLSDEFVEAGINIPALVDSARSFFSEKNLKLLQAQIEALIEQGKIDEAEQLAINYKPFVKEADNSINFGDKSVLKDVENAFKARAEPLIKFPKQLGEFWNDQFVKGGFVALLGAEKRGKTFWLMELAKRGIMEGHPVAFFQAGDMTKDQQIRRFCINLAKQSDQEKYCGEMYQPLCDCIHSQKGSCDKSVRESEFGVFESMTEQQIRQEITLDDLKNAFEDNPNYKACRNCTEYKTHKWGVPWVEKVFVKEPLDERKAKQVWYRFFIKNKRNLRLSTHPNGTLSVNKAKSLLNIWRKIYDFEPKIIIFDYPDIMADDYKSTTSREKFNNIWMGLRSISQENNEPLVIVVTQADADSYSKALLNLKNFSEDKRKYGHVTAMFGLNQDPKGREKKIGIMRINAMVLREGECDVDTVIHVLQNLKRGQPFLGSYF
jgi:hypothetical protein